MITAEDERRYGLKPRPDVPWCGALNSHALQRSYEQQRIRHRQLYPEHDAAALEAKHGPK